MVASVLFTLVACSQQPKTYEDCILDNIKDADSKLAANDIRNACFDKFSPESIAKENSFELSPEQRHKIDGRGYLSDGNTRYNISIYNGNEEVSITEMDVVVIDNITKSEKIYKVDEIIKPLSTKEVSFSIIPINNDHSWGVERGRGANSEALPN